MSNGSSSMISWSTVLTACFVLLAGCDRQPPFRVAFVEMTRSSWDSLSVRLAFEESDLLGNRSAIQPDDVWVTLYNASYDTLFVGSPQTISVPDVELKDREEILLEACGLSGTRRACEQRSLKASPKRIDASSSIDFPLNEAYDRGTYRFDYSIYRQRFDSDEWDRIRPVDQPETMLKAFVHGNSSNAVDIPVRRTRNRFDLRRYQNYRDFRFEIKSHMMDADSAQVDFKLYAMLGDEPVLVSSDSVVIRPKSHAERLDELALLVELAGGDILERLKGFYGLRKAYVFINDWSYQALTRIYTAEIELHWQSGFQSEWFDMTGNLQIKSDGTAGQYEWQQGSQTAERRWFSQIDGSTIRFDSLRSDVGLRPRLNSDASGARRPGF